MKAQEQRRSDRAEQTHGADAQGRAAHAWRQAEEEPSALCREC